MNKLLKNTPHKLSWSNKTLEQLTKVANMLTAIAVFICLILGAIHLWQIWPLG